jgi:hypothetical protein
MTDDDLYMINKKRSVVVERLLAGRMTNYTTGLLLGAVVVGMAFGAPSHGRATTILPTAVWSGAITNSNCSSSLNLCGQSVLPVTGPGVTGSPPQEVVGSVSPSPSIFAETAVPPILLPIDSRSASSDAQLLYNIEVTCSGTSCAITVPVIGLGIGAVGSSPGPTASSDVRLIVGTTTILDVSSQNNTVTGVGPGLTQPVTSAFSYSDTLSLVLDFIYTVELDADTNVGTSAGAQSATAFIDPLFFIDPSFANAGQYSILTSPGIGNSTPLPSTWVMLLTGLAGLGFFAYRGPRKASTRAASRSAAAAV